MLVLAIGASWLPFTAVLRGLGEGKNVTDDTSTFLAYSYTSLPGWMVYFALQGFLNGQGIWWPAVAAIVLSNGVQMGVSYMLINGAGSVRVLPVPALLAVAFPTACVCWVASGKASASSVRRWGCPSNAGCA